MKWAALLALLGVGCTERTDLLPPTDGGVMACSGLGAPIRLGPDSDSPCAGAVAATTVHRALCSCDSLALVGGLTTSGGGPGPGQGPGQGPGGPPTAPSASVASDGDIAVAGLVQVDGSLTAGSMDGMLFERAASVVGTLRSAGSVSVLQLLNVDDNAYVAGDVLGRVDVLGTLFVSPSSNVSPPAAGNNSIVRQPIAIEPPCGCATGPVVDIGALVSTAANANDDVAAGLDPVALSRPHGPTVFELPCGGYYLPSLTSDDTLEVRVHGRSALYIGGDLVLASGLRVTLDSGAELDLFVSGNVTVAAGTLGAATAAAAVRLWAASKTISLGAAASLAAIVYARDAIVQADQDLTAAGALYVDGLDVRGDVSVRFDPAVLDDGSECGQAAVGVDAAVN